MKSNPKLRNKTERLKNKAYRQQRKAEKVTNSKINRSYNREIVSTGKSVVSIIFAFILLVLLIRTINGSPIPTFTSFLELFSTAPSVNVPFLQTVGRSLGDWGLLNGLRDVVAFGLNIVNVLIFLFNGLANLVVYVVWIFRWIFA